jgi:hypothetical protein
LSIASATMIFDILFRLEESERVRPAAIVFSFYNVAEPLSLICFLAALY